MKNISSHHLVRVRMNKKLFENLRDIAQKETELSGEFVSVSDIIRSACLIWKQTYETTSRIQDKTKVSK
jgi:Arc/MetJ-type ribon-helix-helix transcriptional regulator